MGRLRESLEEEGVSEDHDPMKEEWRAIPGSETYEVSSLGQVRNGDRYSKITQRKDGYCVVGIGKKIRFVHALVAEAFLEGKGEVDHLDGDKGNNAVENLQRVTHRENVRRAYASGRTISTGRGRPVVGHTRDWLILFPSIKEAARRVGRSQAAISNALKYGYQAAGARWFYAE